MSARCRRRDDAKLNEAESSENFGCPPSILVPSKMMNDPGKEPVSSHGHLGDLLFQSGDSTVLEDDAVPE